MTHSELQVTRLRCEYLENPLGIDQQTPRLQWQLESARRGARQTAWQIQVASTAAGLANGNIDCWDSGRIDSDQTIHIRYAGEPLGARATCYWQVRVWDEQGNSVCSVPAWWTLGLLEPTDWQAQWIAANPEYLDKAPHAVPPTATQPGTPPWFRKEFELAGPIERATLYASARGLFECYLNGHRVGNDLFTPEWTDYDKRIQYRTYDVTHILQPGPNTLGAILGDGWYSGYVGWQETRGRYGLQNSLIVQLEIRLASGAKITVGTDGSWRCCAGPIIASDFMMGEIYDARQVLDGWSEPGFDDSQWSPVEQVARSDAPLVAQPNEPVRIIEILNPVAVREIGSGRAIADFGQNFSGWVRLRVRGASGTQITLRHGERLNPDGTLYTENLRRAKATDTYILRGGGTETWEPRFTFHGFQYVEISGLPAPPQPGDLVGCVIHSATPQAGSFESAQPLVKRLWQNTLWSQKGNFLSVPTDCPQRDERLGWMGDAQVFLRTASYNMDVAAFFTKWMLDIEDAQTASGVFPDTAPRLREDKEFVGLDGLGGAAGWADAGVIVPWTLWRIYDDQQIIIRHWDAMTRWLSYLERTNPDYIRRNELGNNYGDWLCIPSDTTFRTHSSMKTLLATAYWADDAAKLTAMARAVGNSTAAAQFDAMFQRVRAAFQRKWVRKDGRLRVETQTAYLLALAFDLLPVALRHRTVDYLVENIKGLDWHLSTGFIGIRFLNPILTEWGRADIAWRLLLNEDYPSWLYPVRHGATTIWERWNGWTEEDGFFDPQMNSFNHYSLGSVGEWLYRHVAGIELDPESNGFHQFLIKPYPGGGLDHAGATYHSIRGTITSHWQRQGSQFILEVTIPANTAAKVYLPSNPGTTILEGNCPVEQVDGIESGGRDGIFAVYHVPAGHYRFTASAGYFADFLESKPSR